MLQVVTLRGLNTMAQHTPAGCNGHLMQRYAASAVTLRLLAQYATAGAIVYMCTMLLVWYAMGQQQGGGFGAVACVRAMVLGGAALLTYAVACYAVAATCYYHARQYRITAGYLPL